MIGLAGELVKDMHERAPDQQPKKKGPERDSRYRARYFECLQREEI
jgi:hypothetical protein